MSIRVEGGYLNSPDYIPPHRSVSVLPKPVGHRRNRHPEKDMDRGCSLRWRTNIHHNKNCIRHKNPNIQNSSAVGVPAPEKSSQVLRCDMFVGMALMNKRKPCDLRAFVAFLGFVLIPLGAEPEGVVWQTNSVPETLQ